VGIIMDASFIDQFLDSWLRRYHILAINQKGDPGNTGKGGSSIWGKPFADEIKTHLKHNARGIVSMANKVTHP
jgi:cyclophilin family peptidyl-prolyl cis-trans isomerase